MSEPTYKTYDRTYHDVYNIGGLLYKTICKDKLQLTPTFNALGDSRKYDKYTNVNIMTYNTLHQHKTLEFYLYGDFLVVRGKCQCRRKRFTEF